MTLETDRRSAGHNIKIPEKGKEEAMRFNFSQKGRQPAETRYAFVTAGLRNTQWDLFTTLLSGSLTSSPAEHQAEDLYMVRQAIRSNDAGDIARLAIYLAEEKNFRELAFLLTAELAAVAGNDENTGTLMERIIRTPLDIPLWLDYYARAVAKAAAASQAAVTGSKTTAAVSKQGSKPGRSVRKHLTILFNKLDEYMYSRSTPLIREALRDALRWLRPKAMDRSKKALFSAILRDQLRTRTTWEQEWHALYQQHYDSAEQRQVVLRDKWKEGISSFRIGYKPLLDNLRPMLCAGVSGKVLKLAAEYLGNAAAVKRSGTHPLRLLEVYRTLRRMEQGGAGMLTEALDKAVLHSSWAQLGLGSNGVSVIAIDVSNSMKRPVNGSYGAYRFDIAPLLAMLWKSRGNEVITGIIGNTWRPLELPERPVLLTVDEFRAREGKAGYAINAWLILRDLLRKKQVVDRVMIFTDCRLWDNRGFNQTPGTDLGYWWRLYRDRLAPQAKLYLFDLAGYGSQPLECLSDNVYLVAGWNEKIPDILDMLDETVAEA
jgi:60 kDa SS-A/Ro ribonucleoprotein